VRVTDFVARYGGEEFVVLLPDVRDVREGLTVAEKLRAAVAAHDFGAVGPLTVSIGLGCTHSGDRVPDDLVGRADKALYQAKQQGRNRTVALPLATPETPAGSAAFFAEQNGRT